MLLKSVLFYDDIEAVIFGKFFLLRLGFRNIFELSVLIKHAIGGAKYGKFRAAIELIAYLLLAFVFQILNKFGSQYVALF